MDNRPKLLVMGGSFNPPTRAHVDFLLDAMRQMEAKEGIFVPSSHRYVSRKMAKYQEWNPVYTEAQRLEMLERICELYPNLSVMIGEYGDDGRGHTYETLETIQADRPGYRVLFLIGADKLDIIPRWKDIGHLLHRFELVVSTRDESDTDVIQQYIKHHPTLSAYQERFHVLSRERRYLDGDISSTMARKRVIMNDWEGLSKLVTPGVLSCLRQIVTK